MKKYIGILLALLLLTMNGMAARNDDLQSALDNIDIKNIGNIDIKNMDNIDINKITDVVKNVDYDKLKNMKPEDFPLITEDLISGMGRIDYVYHADFKDVKFNATRRTTSPATTSSYCYKTFGKWYYTPVNYVINPSNSQGLSDSFLSSRIYNSAETWDAQTSKELFGNTYTINSGVQYGSYDGNNVIDIGSYGDPGVIAVTSIWYNIYTKRIYEFDMRLNNAFTWSDATTDSRASIMDVQDIVTHELGHSVGLKDLYTSSCSQATMYGYSSYREVKKRTLESGDIKGLRVLYGS